MDTYSLLILGSLIPVLVALDSMEDKVRWNMDVFEFWHAVWFSLLIGMWILTPLCILSALGISWIIGTPITLSLGTLVTAGFLFCSLSTLILTGMLIIFLVSINFFIWILQLMPLCQKPKH